MTAAAPWLKKITPSIFETLSLSDQGTIPKFPLDAFSKTLGDTLGQQDLSIKIERMDFISGDNFYTGLSEKTIVIPLTMTPLSGTFYFVMGILDIQTLISCMEKTEEGESPLSLDNESVIKGLYTYILTEAIDSIMKLDIYKDMSIKITEGTISDLSCYGIDLTLSLKNNHLPARILIPNDFYSQINSHFSFIAPTVENLENITDVSIPMSIRTGSVTLSKEELEGVVEGDFLIIRNSFYNIEKAKGSFQMLIGTSPLFQIKNQKDGIKILDYLYFYNEENMDDNDVGSPLGDDFTDDFSKDILDDLPEDLPDGISPDLPDGLPLQEELLADKNMDPSKIDDDEQKDTMLTPEKTNLSSVPLTVHMELARFSLSLDELKKLGPGFKLPIKINPLYVNLVVSGKSIGTGEIIEVGDTLGVKVTKLY